MFLAFNSKSKELVNKGVANRDYLPAFVFEPSDNQLPLRKNAKAFNKSYIPAKIFKFSNVGLISSPEAARAPIMKRPVRSEISRRGVRTLLPQSQQVCLVFRRQMAHCVRQAQAQCAVNDESKLRICDTFRWSEFQGIPRWPSERHGVPRFP